MSRNSSCSSDEFSVKNQSSIKFLCSYDGKILPRQKDGKLRYAGGIIRVLSVDRSVIFSELSTKLTEMCGSTVCLRCQLPTEDLDALVSITSDDDLFNILEEYDRANRERSDPLKIRAFLLPYKPKSPPRAPKDSIVSIGSRPISIPVDPLTKSIYIPTFVPNKFDNFAGYPRCFSCFSHANFRNLRLVPQGTRWQYS